MGGRRRDVGAYRTVVAHPLISDPVESAARPAGQPGRLRDHGQGFAIGLRYDGHLEQHDGTASVRFGDEDDEVASNFTAVEPSIELAETGPVVVEPASYS